MLVGVNFYPQFNFPRDFLCASINIFVITRGKASAAAAIHHARVGQLWDNNNKSMEFKSANYMAFHTMHLVDPPPTPPPC